MLAEALDAGATFLVICALLCGFGCGYGVGAKSARRRFEDHIESGARSRRVGH